MQKTGTFETVNALYKRALVRHEFMTAERLEKTKTGIFRRVLDFIKAATAVRRW